MWFTKATYLALFAFGCMTTAKPKSADRFKDFHTKSLSSTPLRLDDNTYDDLTTGSRNYTAVVLLTALDARFGCQLCKDFQPEWELLAKSWTKADKRGDSRTLYAQLDFADGKGTFQKLMLQTAPVLYLFPPSIGPDARAEPIRYDFTLGMQSAEQIHGWIIRHLPAGSYQPPIQRPFNYIRIVFISTAVLGLITFFSVTAPYILPVVQNRNLWAAISLLIILLFTSGHMFNHIRKVPYVSGDGNGNIVYFAGGFSNQFGLETQIVAGMYGILSLATIALALKVPRISDPQTQQIAVFTWGGVMFFMYSFLLSVFRIKNGGYPFHLPPF